MPAYECFEKRIQFPKAYKVFYHYFYKCVVGERNWADAIENKSEFGNFNTEAFTHMVLKNNYTAWTAAMMSTKEHLKTQYDVQAGGRKGEDSKTLFDAIDLEVEYEDVDACDDEQTHLMCFTEKRNKEIYKKALERRRDMERQITNEVALQTKLLEEIQLAKNDLLQCELENNVPKNDKSKKRRKVLQDMKPFTRSKNPKELEAPNKKKKKSQRKSSIKDKKLGWFYSGHRFMQEKCLEIRKDRSEGVYTKFECTYRKMYTNGRDDEDDDEEESEERFEIDKDLLWSVPV